MQIIKLTIFISLFLFSCNNTKVSENIIDSNQVKNLNENNMYNNVEKTIIITIPEMSSNQELDSFKFSDAISVSLSDLKLATYKKQIQDINLADISKWAKEQMQGYKLPDNFIENLQIEKSYITKDLTAIKIKSVELPSHSPLVKRFLYLIPVYDSNHITNKIYVTIQGYVEE